MSAVDPSTDQRRFFFLHMQKTGGTSLFLRLPRVFGAAGVYPNDTDGDPVTVAPQLSIDVLLQRWAVRRDQIGIVAGHFPLCTTELLGEEFRVLTVLREPVERTLSYLRHHRQTTPADRDTPLEAIYEDDFRFHGMIHDHMVKMLAMTTEEMTAGLLTRLDCTEAHLVRAQERLEGIEVVGLLERFDEFWDDLERQLGWDLNEVAHANRSAPVDAPASLRRRIAEDNALDVALYEHARALVLDRAAGRRRP